MLENVTNQFNNLRDAATEKINSFGKPGDLFISLGLYGLAGFLAGVLFKHLGKFLIITILITAAILYGFQHFGIITIHKTAFANFFGLTGPITLKEIWLTITTWVKLHTPQSIAIGIGVLLAWLFA